MANLGTPRSAAPQSSPEPRAAHDGLGCGITLVNERLLRNSLVLSVALAALGIAMQAPAANQQQERMKSCNAQAKSQTLAGDERKGFMQRCLSGQDAAPAHELNSQQRKMKSCNEEASSHGLKGTARSHFMSTCLK